MNLKICDRCKKELTNNYSDFTLKKRTMIGELHVLDCDLCEDCAKEFKNWLKGETNGSR